jgi:cell shape-determining protein MreD
MEVAFLPFFTVFGLQPNLTLVLLVCWITVRGLEESLYLIPVAGLTLGLVDGASLGVALIALAPIAVLYELRGATFGEGPLLITIAFTVVATVAYQSVYLLAFAAGGHSGDILAAVLRVIVPVSLLNVAVLLPTYWVTWALSPDVRRGMFA